MASQPMNLLSWVNHAQPVESVDALLREVLPELVVQMPTVAYAQVYRLSRGGMTCWMCTRDEASIGTYQPIEPHSPYARALETGSPLLDDGAQQLIAPLTSAQGQFGLLRLGYEGEAPTLGDVDELATQLALLVHNVQLQELLTRQLETTTQLNESDTFRDLAFVMASHMVEREQYVGINLFQYNRQGELIGGWVLATASSQRSFPADEPILVAVRYLQHIHDVLRAEGELLVSDLEQEELLDPAGLAYLQSRNVKSMYLLPLYLQERLYAFISVIDTNHTLALTPAERRMYRAVAVQASNTVERRQLLENTEAALRETQTLYGLIGSLMAAEDVPDILQVLHEHVGQDTRSINLTELMYDEQGVLRELLVTHVLRDGQIKEANLQLHKVLTPETLRALTTFWQQQEDRVEVVADVVAAEDYPLREMLLREDIASVIALPIMEQGRRTRQITLTWERKRAFDEQLLKLLQTARSQIALVLQNRRLLADTRQRAVQSGEQARVLALMNDIIIATNTEQDETTLLKRTAEVLREATGVDHVGIGLVDPGEEVVVIAAEMPETDVVGRRVDRIVEGIPNLLRRNHGLPVLIHDVQRVTTLPENSRTALQSTGAQSSFFLPMFDLQQNLMGSIGFDYFETVDEFDPNIIKIAQTIVSQVSINLQKLRLVKEAQQQAAQMQRLTSFSEAMQASLQQAEILQRALELMPGILPVDFVAVLLYDRKQERLRLTALYRNWQRSVNLPGTIIEKERDSVADLAWTRQELVHVEALQSDWTWKHPFVSSLQSILAAPLVATGVRVGVLEIGHKQAAIYDKVDIAAFEQLSNQLAVGIANAEAYAQSQQLARYKVLANDIIAQLQRQAEVGDILRVTATELGRALGASKARIRLSTHFEPTGDER